MFIFKDTERRANPYAPYTAEDGTRYARIPRELLEEIPDPQPPEDYSDETYYRTEQDEGPQYVIYTKKSPEQLEQLADSKALAAARQHLSDTDYLFLTDRNEKLKQDEAQRDAELRASREAAREVIRAYKLKYPQP